MDRVSFCNISVIQQDKQCFMIEFIHNIAVVGRAKFYLQPHNNWTYRVVHKYNIPNLQHTACKRSWE